MPHNRPKALNEHLAARETVLLLFNKRDSEIERSWAQAAPRKDKYDPQA